jgi:putative ABC transport system permease protein
MRLALRELRRRPGRFAAAALILTLLAGLVVFLTGLANGLNANTDGALTTQRSDLVVFADVAEDQLPQSLVTPGDRAAVEAVDGVADVGRLTVQQLGARLPDRDDRDLVDVVVAGFERPIRGADGPPDRGTGLADTTLRERGIRVGTTIAVGPARTPVEIVGEVDRAGFQGQGGLWVSPETLVDVVAANAPGDALPEGASQALVVDVDDATDPAEVAAAVDEATGTTSTLTTAAAAAAVPDIGGGVIQQIIGLTLVIAVAVTALFFALLTAERIGLYGVLKAIGATTRTLLAGVVAQAVVLAALGSAVALAAALAFDAAVPPDGVPFQLTARSVGVALVALLVAAVGGAALSVRRVARIDPARAIGAST